MIAFTRRCKPNMKRIITEVSHTVGRTNGFNTETMIQLSVYLEIRLQFQTHKNLIFETPRSAEDRW